MRKLLLAMAVLTLACGSDSTDPTMASVAGTWHLFTVDGVALPYTLEQSSADKLELSSDVFTVTSTGSFTQMTVLKVTQNGEVSTEVVPDAGTYSLNGNSVLIVFQSDGSSVTGTLNDDQLTIASTGVALVYLRQ
jgi:hypothetical protein